VSGEHVLHESENSCMHSADDVTRVRAALESGKTDQEASDATGVPVSTVGRWGRGETYAFGPALPRAGQAPRQWRRRYPNWRPPERLSFAYHLGLYLGDGCVVRRGRAVGLQLSLDALYPEIIEDAYAAVQLTTITSTVKCLPVKDSRCMTVLSYWQG
jgi:hypothetical protein